MESTVTLLDFDGVYRRQSFYKNEPHEWIDFESLSITNLFCERDNLKSMEEKLSEQKASNIVYIGSGNYHYVSHVLQSKMKKPYTLILFDHHTDTIPSPSEALITCGSWVLESLQHLPMLKKVFIIGVSEEVQQHIPDSYFDKVVTYTKHALQSDLSTIKQSITNNIPTDSVYISIDKDVLDNREALTNWDHGTLQLKQMMRIVHAIIQVKGINGIDICGEYPVNPTNEFEKTTIEAIKKNNYVNGFILKYMKKWMTDNPSPRLLHA